VFIGRLDGKLVALDQKTGQVAWQRQVVRWQDGGTITAAPLYYDGTVITGVSGGEFGIRGRVAAYDAATGKERWRFYTIPGRARSGTTRGRRARTSGSTAGRRSGRPPPSTRRSG